MSILIAGGTKGIGLAIGKAFAPDAGDVFLNFHGDDAAAARAAANSSGVTTAGADAPPGAISA